MWDVGSILPGCTGFLAPPVGQDEGGNGKDDSRNEYISNWGALVFGVHKKVVKRSLQQDKHVLPKRLLSPVSDKKRSKKGPQRTGDLQSLMLSRSVWTLMLFYQRYYPQRKFDHPKVSPSSVFFLSFDFWRGVDQSLIDAR